jgi:hypothetical protein
MKSIALGSGINRRTLISTLILIPALSGTLLPASAQAQVTQGGLTDFCLMCVVVFAAGKLAWTWWSSL